ncbi:MAG TPA: hypothetical protein VGJ02_07315 [Pyrinomonadaceae bacterium]|jgi:ElaB/YqjD/DUF883 family membrane-anchored ribosome-binding protein
MDNEQKDQRNTSSTGPVPESVPGNKSMGTSTPNAGTPAPRNAAPSTPATNVGSAADPGNKLKDSATDLYEHAKDTASDSYDAVATKAKTAVNEQKNQFSAGLKTVADSIRHMGGQLRDAPESNRLTDVTSDFTGKAAGTIDNVANYFDRKDPREMVRDVQGFARRNPAIFFGTAFALGLLAARFLKSSKPDQMSHTSNMPMGQPNTALPASANRPEGGALPQTF